jgi:hypothetical protein
VLGRSSATETDADADKTNPVEGKLVHLGIDEVMVEVDTGVRVHLLRVGQSIEKASVIV